MEDHSDYCSFKATSPVGDQVRSILQKILLARVVLSNASLLHKIYQPRIYGTPPALFPDLTLKMPKSGKVSPIVDGLARIIVAITGGVFLLVPMVIMTWATDAHVKLIIVSVAVLWFAISVALVSNATNQELIGANMAYSAVLVVYVGTTSGSLGH
jgi:VIT1/CCC1 family predicted Fe2+/Mn2+ transporter